MRPHRKKLVGTCALFVLVIVWALLAMAFAQFAFASTNSLAAIVYYVVIGLGWVLPALPLVKWMSRP
jgi:hypothetical protein